MQKYIYRLFLIIISITISNKAKSQSDKNSWLIGGSFHVSDYKEKANFSIWVPYTMPIKKISFDMNLGYFIKNNFLVGLRSNYGYIRGKAITPSVTKLKYYQDLHVGPFSRYYFGDGNKYNFIIDGCIQYSKIKFHGFKSNQKTFSISTGPSFYINSSFGIEFLIGYKYARRNGSDSSNGIYSNISGINTNLNLHFYLTK